MRDRITELHDEGWTDAEIAREVGLTRSRIQNVRSKVLGLPRILRWKRPHKCVTCGTEFMPENVNQRRCGRDRRFTSRLCGICGKGYRGTAVTCLQCRMRANQRARRERARR